MTVRGSSSAVTSAVASSGTRPPTSRRAIERQRLRPRTACTPGGCGGSTPASATRPRSASAPTPRSTDTANVASRAYVLERVRPRLYEIEVEVEFSDRLRGMVSFDSVEALVAQMKDDVTRARELLAAGAAQCQTPTPSAARRPGSSSTGCPTSSTTCAPRSAADSRGRGSCWCCSSRCWAAWPPGSRWAWPAARARPGSRSAPGSWPASRRRLRALRAADARHRGVGAQARLRQPRAAVPARHQGTADAAHLRDVPVHQHRGLLAGDLGDGRWGHLGGRAVLRTGRHRLPGGAARRGASTSSTTTSRSTPSSTSPPTRPWHRRRAGSSRRARTCRPRPRSRVCRRRTWCSSCSSRRRCRCCCWRLRSSASSCSSGSSRSRTR